MTGDILTRGSIWLALLVYAVAVVYMLHAKAANPWPRRFWTTSWLLYIAHVVAAFHFHHHWSHAAAVDHVQSESGFGPGLFVSYLFTLVWTIDVAWWWLSPHTHDNRPPWIDTTFHAFFAFIVVNATVVFETGISRLFGVLLIGVVAVAWITRRTDTTG